MPTAARSSVPPALPQNPNDDDDHHLWTNTTGPLNASSFPPGVFKVSTWARAAAKDETREQLHQERNQLPSSSVRSSGTHSMVEVLFPLSHATQGKSVTQASSPWTFQEPFPETVSTLLQGQPFDLLTRRPSATSPGAAQPPKLATLVSQQEVGVEQGRQGGPSLHPRSVEGQDGSALECLVKSSQQPDQRSTSSTTSFLTAQPLYSEPASRNIGPIPPTTHSINSGKHGRTSPLPAAQHVRGSCDDSCPECTERARDLASVQVGSHTWARASDNDFLQALQVEAEVEARQQSLEIESWVPRPRTKWLAGGNVAVHRAAPTMALTYERLSQHCRAVRTLSSLYLFLSRPRKKKTNVRSETARDPRSNSFGRSGVTAYGWSDLPLFGGCSIVQSIRWVGGSVGRYEV